MLTDQQQQQQQPSSMAKHILGETEESETLMQLNYSLQLQHALLIFIGSVGILGNVVVMAAILSIRALRKCSSAFLFHQCFLDLLKSLNCLLLAHNILSETEPPFCSVLGGSFIVCVTASAFNMLGMAMNEAYVFADLSTGMRDSANHCCVLFSVSTIWFASIILNLGVAFLPGSAKYIPTLGICMFEYGVTRHYVLHVLWILLVTFGLLLTSIYLKNLYRDMNYSRYSKVSELLPTFSQMMTMLPVQEDVSAKYEEIHHNQWKLVTRYTRRRLHKLLVLVSLFIAFWYPLFMLTLLDRNFEAPPLAYKSLIIFACCNSSVSPYLFWSLVIPSCSFNQETLLEEPLLASQTSTKVPQQRVRSHAANVVPSGPLMSPAVHSVSLRASSPLPVLINANINSPKQRENQTPVVLQDCSTEEGIFNEFYLRTDPQSSGYAMQQPNQRLNSIGSPLLMHPMYANPTPTRSTSTIKPITLRGTNSFTTNF